MPTRPKQRQRPRVETAVSSRTSVGMGAGGGSTKAEKKWSTSSYPTDRHRRRYHATVSTVTGTAISLIPLFRAPVMPPPDCLKVPVEQPWHVEIDYQKWIARALAEDKEHLAIRRALAQKEYKEFAAGKENSERVLELTGDAPKNIRTPAGFASNAILIALAFHGDPWATGKQTERTAAVIKEIGEAPQELDLEFLLDTKGQFAGEVARLLGETRLSVKQADDEDDEANWEPSDEQLEEQAALEAERLAAASGDGVGLEDDDVPLFEGGDEGDGGGDDKVAQFGTETPVADAAAGGLRNLAALDGPPAPANTGRKGKSSRPPAGGK